MSSQTKSKLADFFNTVDSTDIEEKSIQAEKTSKKSPNKASATISVDLIQNADYQPRKYFDKAALEKLATSIQKHGIIEPLVVRPLEN
ncbi:ParB N-terminal domain-containing protein, partial [Okeania sp. SIO2G5]|uniref:ParB N-terminal domain-containing protein n=1 Tax=Okeania sp. SIO2G5 TaxID=2607796 RepID=UPI0013C0276F